MLLQVKSEILLIVSIMVAMLLVIAFFSVYLFFLFQKRKMRLLQQQEAMRKAYEQEILKTQIEIRDQAMNDVGIELHDHISQVMTLIKLNLNLISSKGLAAQEEKRLSETKQLVAETINDIRMLSKTLNGELPAIIGFAESVRHELERINRLNIMTCTLDVTGEPFDLNPDKSFIMLRIVQEALHNAVKHSGGKKMYVKIDFTGHKLQLTLKDNGKGFNYMDTQYSAGGSGSGLKSIKRRADMIKADLAFHSSPGQGTNIVLTVA